MTDIVERLHDAKVCSVAENSCRNQSLLAAAAAEIELLRMAAKASDILATCTLWLAYQDDAGNYCLTVRFEDPQAVRDLIQFVN